MRNISCKTLKFVESRISNLNSEIAWVNEALKHEKDSLLFEMLMDNVSVMSEELWAFKELRNAIGAGVKSGGINIETE